jgi:hypothetical protein
VPLAMVLGAAVIVIAGAVGCTDTVTVCITLPKGLLQVRV